MATPWSASQICTCSWIEWPVQPAWLNIIARQDFHAVINFGVGWIEGQALPPEIVS